jgi:hypothetical protein
MNLASSIPHEISVLKKEKKPTLTKKIKRESVMKDKNQNILHEIQGTAEEIIGQIKSLIKKGNAKRVIVKNKNGKILFQSQLTLGAAGATFFVIYAPVLSAITTLMLMASDVSVFVEADESETDEYEVQGNVIEIDEDEDEK